MLGPAGHRMLSHHQQAGMYSSVGPPGLMGDFVMQVQLAHPPAFGPKLLGADAYLKPWMRPNWLFVCTVCGSGMFIPDP
jgi:hypothetical protein